MNNYTWLEQKLHQIALSTQFMREAMFDVESTFVPSSPLIDDHIFIAGLARAGTTILLNALYKSDVFASLSYSDMPFVLAPNLWSKLNLKKKNTDFRERAHKDGIKVSTESPEAFVEVFWRTFVKESEENLEELFCEYVSNIIHKYKKRRYLSKNNQNIRRLKFITCIFNKSKILVPFRDPIQHSYSLLTQHKKFIEDSKSDKFIAKYMKWIGHTEFGPNYVPLHKKNLKFENDLDINHWIEQWYLTYFNAYKLLETTNNLNFICYEKLCRSKDYWYKIQKIVNIDKIYDFEFKESRKYISFDIDKELSKKATTIYSDLSSLDLN